MNDSSIEIRPFADVAEVAQIEDIQRQAWNRFDLEIVPGRLLYAMEHNGACLIGAFDDEKVVGFAFGILGTDQESGDRVDQVAAARLLLYSVIMGVLPEYQSHGVGYRLKMAQREFSLRIGVRLITWTYDPLESLNGYFNVSKLGVICHRYLDNYYGEMGGINVGLPTDRFYVEWWVTSNRVESRVSKRRGPLSLDSYLSGRAVIVNESDRDDRQLPVPPADFLRLENNLVLVEIPDSIQEIKSSDMALPQRWREHGRQVFKHYFDRHYMVTDFLRSKDADGLPRSYYVLTQMDG